MPATMTLGERIRGKRTRDIALPQEGPTDPRLEDFEIERDSRSMNPLKRVSAAMRRGRRQVKRAGRR